LGKDDEALASFGRAASINSSYAEPWYNIGRIYDNEGDLDSAIKAYNRATEINPNYQNAWFNKDQDMDSMGIGHSSLYNELSGNTHHNCYNIENALVTTGMRSSGCIKRILNQY